jgi:hypothetical protein
MTGAGTRIRRYWRRRAILTFLLGMLSGAIVLGLVWLHKSRPGWWKYVTKRSITSMLIWRMADDNVP